MLGTLNIISAILSDMALKMLGNKWKETQHPIFHGHDWLLIFLESRHAPIHLSKVNLVNGRMIQAYFSGFIQGTLTKYPTKII